MPDNEQLPALAELMRLHALVPKTPIVSEDYTELPEGVNGISIPELEVFLVPPGFMPNDTYAEFFCAAHNLLPAVEQQVRELVAENERLTERCETLNHKEWPVWQVCEKCGPAVLDDAGKCPTCNQVYDFKLWREWLVHIAELEGLLRRVSSTVTTGDKPQPINIDLLCEIDAALSKDPQ